MNNSNQKIILFPIPIGELKEIIVECIRLEIQKIAPPPPKDNTLISRKDAAKMLHVSVASLSKYCKSGIITSYRLNNMLRFKRQDILDSLKEMKTIKFSRTREY